MKTLPPDVQVAVVNLTGTGGAAVCAPCVMDGQRMLILQFKNIISGDLLPPLGIPLTHVPKFLSWLEQAVDKEVKRLQTEAAS